MTKWNFLGFFARRVMRCLDVDGSGDLDLDEITAMKETWATAENKRETLTKVEVDAMRQGWEDKEKRYRPMASTERRDLVRVGAQHSHESL